jgi:hypothetical protein
MFHNVDNNLQNAVNDARSLATKLVHSRSQKGGENGPRQKTCQEESRNVDTITKIESVPASTDEVRRDRHW